VAARVSCARTRPLRRLDFCLPGEGHILSALTDYRENIGRLGVQGKGSARALRHVALGCATAALSSSAA
jgi:hypothetical protein